MRFCLGRPQGEQPIAERRNFRFKKRRNAAVRSGAALCSLPGNFSSFAIKQRAARRVGRLQFYGKLGGKGVRIEYDNGSRAFFLRNANAPRKRLLGLVGCALGDGKRLAILVARVFIHFRRAGAG